MGKEKKIWSFWLPFREAGTPDEDVTQWIWDSFLKGNWGAITSCAPLAHPLSLTVGSILCPCKCPRDRDGSVFLPFSSMALSNLAPAAFTLTRLPARKLFGNVLKCFPFQYFQTGTCTLPFLWSPALYFLTPGLVTCLPCFLDLSAWLL